MRNAEQKQIYHIAGEEKDVYSVANLIYRELKGTDLPDEVIRFVDFHAARPGHDKRYSLSMEKLRRMGWAPKYGLEDCIKRVTKNLSGNGLSSGLGI